MSIFQPNWNLSKTPYVALDKVQTVDKGHERQIRQDSSSNFDPLK